MSSKATSGFARSSRQHVARHNRFTHWHSEQLTLRHSSHRQAARHNQAYSLIELLVVIAVITVVGLASIPNIFNRNDRLSLDSSANQLRQVIIDARTRALAPDKSDSSNLPQVFQVVLGKFSQAANQSTATISGGVTTSTVSLERGAAQCDNGDPQGGFSTLRSFSFPRGIYTAAFYPTIQTSSDDRSIVRFFVGKDGFSCGGYSNANFGSQTLLISGWSGIRADAGRVVSRYLVITLASQKIGEKRYVAVDRATGDVTVSRSNPQSYFTPTGDGLAPRWTDKDPSKFLMSISCSTSTSRVIMSFPRANDRTNDPNSDDPNLFVVYDINWDIGGGSKPLAVHYFFDLAENIVRYEFTTDGFSIANQPHQVTVTVSAVDATDHAQATYDANNPLDVTAQRLKIFTPSCGNVVSDPIKDPAPPFDPNDPGGGSKACNPVVLNRPEDGWLKQMFSKIVGRAMAARINACPPEIFQ